MNSRDVRPLLHLTPSTGWLNDPNGSMQRGGVHHVYFQWNPHAPDFGSMHWGHATTTDLLTWQQYDSPALAPRPGGVDAGGTWSGSAVQVDDKVTFIYTAVGEGFAPQLPVLARPADPDTLHPLTGAERPLLKKAPQDFGVVTDFRDHCLERDGEGWRMLVGAGIDDRGAVIGLKGRDLEHWSQPWVYADTQTCPIPGVVYECPDSFEVDGHRILVISSIEAPDDSTVYWSLGSEIEDCFTSEQAERFDLGSGLFYAPQSYVAEDGRRLMFGWLRLHLTPRLEGRDWIGAMSLPLEVNADEEGLRVRPAREVDAARGEQLGEGDDQLDDLGDVFELEVSAGEGPVTLTGGERSLELDLSGFNGELQLFFDRGIVEVFADGRYGSWYDAYLTSVDRASLPGRHGVATRLRLP